MIMSQVGRGLRMDASARSWARAGSWFVLASASLFAMILVRERAHSPIEGRRRGALVSLSERAPARTHVDFADAFRLAAKNTGVSEALLHAVARVESDFNPHARSNKGAMGVMQLMPRTARAMGVGAPYDPRENIAGGARYLRALLDRWDGDLVLAVASYNAGPAVVARHAGIPPYRETQRYVRRVLNRYQAHETSADALVHLRECCRRHLGDSAVCAAGAPRSRRFSLQTQSPLEQR